MIELGQILSGLVQRTAEGKLKWTRAAEDGQFVASIDAISVKIAEDGDLFHRLDLLDESGEIVESFVYKDTTDEEDEELGRLFVLARRSAHDVNSVLEKLAKGLELQLPPSR